MNVLQRFCAIWGDVLCGGRLATGGGDVLRLYRVTNRPPDPRTFPRCKFCNDIVCDLGGHFVTGGRVATIVCVIWVDVMCGRRFAMG